MVLIGVLSFGVVIPHALISQFQVTVTYLFMSSLILTGPVQLSFTRFVSDRLCVKDEAAIQPNFNALLFVVLLKVTALHAVLAGGVDDLLAYQAVTHRHHLGRTPHPAAAGRESLNQTRPAYAGLAAQMRPPPGRV
jgi:uncharacterized membrane protein